MRKYTRQLRSLQNADDLECSQNLFLELIELNTNLNSHQRDSPFLSFILLNLTRYIFIYSLKF